MQAALADIAAAVPSVWADPFDGDRDAAVHDLYACAVDQIARDRLHEAGVPLARRSRRGSPTAVEHFLQGLAAPEALLPRHPGYPALERKLSEWVDAGLGRRSVAPWLLSLHLDERPATTLRAGDDGDTAPALVLELWLQAADDPTLSLPASLLWSGDDEIFGFLRASDPRRALQQQVTAIEPVLAEHGIAFDLAQPAEAELDPASSPRSCARRCPGSTSSGCPCCFRATGSARRASCAST